MAVTLTTDEKTGQKLARGRSRRALYVSQSLTAEAQYQELAHVNVNVSIGPDWVESLAEKVIGSTARPFPKANSKAISAGAMREALKTAATELLTSSFAAEIGKVVSAYRLMLRESLARGGDSELHAALNRARLQEKILASTTMVDQAQACQLLGLSGANPSATMKRKEDKQEVLRFTIDGRAVYPFFQFDVDSRCVFPAMAQVMAKKPKGWSDFRLLHWMTRPHLDMEGTPAEALGTNGDAVIAAFTREVEPVMHG